MRTTIDIPPSIRQKLITEASLRHLKGFSSIIVEALERYFESSKAERLTSIDSLEGCLSREEYLQEISRLEEGRKNWKI